MEVFFLIFLIIIIELGLRFILKEEEKERKEYEKKKNSNAVPHEKNNKLKKKITPEILPPKDENAPIDLMKDYEQFYPVIVRILPIQDALKYKVVVLQEKENSLTVAMVDPSDDFVIHIVEETTGKKVTKRYLCLEQDLKKFIHKMYDKEQIKDDKEKKLDVQPVPQYKSTHSVNYDDFGVCSKCNRVNFKNSPKCRHCGNSSAYKPIHQETGCTGCGCSVVIICMLMGLLGGFLIICILEGLGSGISYTECSSIVPLIGGVIGLIIGCSISAAMDNPKKDLENKYKLRANELFKSNLTGQKTDVEKKFKEAIFRFEEGQYQQAINLFIETSSLGGASDFGVAVSHYNLEDYDTAIPLLEKILSEKSYPGAWEILVRSYIIKGISEEKQVKHLSGYRKYAQPELKKTIILELAKYFRIHNLYVSETMDILKEAIEIEPENLNYKEALVKYLFANNQEEDAVSICEDFPEDSISPDILELYIPCLIKSKTQDDRKVSLLKRYISLNPEKTDVRINLVRVLIKNKQYEIAISILKEGIEINPGDVTLKYNLSLTYLLQGEVEPAIEQLQGILRTDNFESYISKSDVYRQMGKCLEKKNMYSMALKQYLQADRSEQTLDLLYQLGEIFESQDDKQNAKTCWEEIYSSDVTFRDVSKKISSL